MSEQVSVDKAYLEALEREHGAAPSASFAGQADERIPEVKRWQSAWARADALRPKPPDVYDVLHRLAMYSAGIGDCSPKAWAGILDDARAAWLAHEKSAR